MAQHTLCRSVVVASLHQRPLRSLLVLARRHQRAALLPELRSSNASQQPITLSGLRRASKHSLHNWFANLDDIALRSAVIHTLITHHDNRGRRAHPLQHIGLLLRGQPGEGATSLDMSKLMLASDPAHAAHHGGGLHAITLLHCPPRIHVDARETTHRIIKAFPDAASPRLSGHVTHLAVGPLPDIRHRINRQLLCARRCRHPLVRSHKAEAIHPPHAWVP
mmetsp:Transcript_10906/g.25658  ORF Transcript_10906/g.25658 Transcript_10906/m.25658 type:complete len:221 (-) Transcript_10906:171-833(-)